MKLAQQGEAGVGGTHVVSQPVGDATETPALHFPLSRGPAVTRKSPGWVDVRVSSETASTHLDVLFYVCRGLSLTFLVLP